MNDVSTTSNARVGRGFSFDTASIWVLTATFVVAALIFTWAPSFPFIYTKVTVLAIGGLIAIALYILARLIRGNVIVPPLTLIGALWLVPLAYALSSLFSGEAFGTAFFGAQLEQDTFGFVLLLALVATLAALAFRRTNHYRVFFKGALGVLAITVVAEIILLILAHVKSPVVSGTSNLTGSFMDLGMLTGLMLTGLMLANRAMRFSGWKRIVLWVLGVASLALLALVNSPLLWILTALVALGLFIEAILRRRVNIDEAELEGVETLSMENEQSEMGEESRSLIAPLVVLVAALFFLIGGSTIGSALTNSFGTSTLDVRPSWRSTFDVGSHTYASSPIFGSGPGTFGQQWLKFRDRSLNQTVFWNVDFNSGIGLIPTSFVTEGLLGALAWIAFLGLFIFFGLRALLFRAPVDPYARFVAVSSFTGALYVFALMIFGVPGPVVLMAGFALVGIFISSLRYAGARQEWGVIFARNPRVGFVIVFLLTLLLLGSVLAAYVVTERYLAEHAYSQAIVDLNKGDLTAATSDINRAILFSKTDRAYQLAAQIGMAQMAKIASDTTLTPTQAQQQFQSALSQTVQAALTATKLGPNNYQNWVILGQVYGDVVPLKIEGAYANAKAAYQHAEALNPTNPTLPFILAQLEIAQGNAKPAEDDLNQAIGLKSDYTQAIFLLAQLKAQEGEAKAALQAAEAAAYFAPNDPTVLFEVGLLRSANGDTAGAVQALSQAVQLNPQYANARFFLGVMYALQNKYPEAVAQLQAVAALSKENAAAVAPDIAQLQAGKNPFPPSRLGALGLSQPGVTDAAPTTNTATSSKSVTK
jgi:tetratricopeptide (TPR) repeat protein